MGRSVMFVMVIIGGSLWGNLKFLKIFLLHKLSRTQFHLIQLLWVYVDKWSKSGSGLRCTCAEKRVCRVLLLLLCCWNFDKGFVDWILEMTIKLFLVNLIDNADEIQVDTSWHCLALLSWSMKISLTNWLEQGAKYKAEQRCVWTICVVSPIVYMDP